MNTQQLIKTLQAALASLVLFGGVTSTSIASTPDGETPANEGVCDVLQGGSPGLYGLCVAYCEAQDLDMVESNDPPNSKILANYRKKMKAGDPDMPCLQTPCPCWTADQLANIGSTGDMPVCTISTTSSTIRVLTTNAFQQAVANSSRNTCGFNDSTTVPATALNFSITPEEVQICRSQIDTACNAMGQQ